jgi:lipopolysaccharide export LptBFGC system permease protein LptF
LYNVGTNLVNHQQELLDELQAETQEYTADKDSLNTKYLNLVYELEDAQSQSQFYAIQRNLVLVLALLVLLVRNGYLGQTIGMMVGGFVALVMGLYYVFATYYNTYRRDPLDWNEMSTDISKQALPTHTSSSCPSASR